MENKNILTIILAVGLVLVSLVSIYSFTNAIPKDVTERNTISVSGTSELDVLPDKVEIYFRIETNDNVAKFAQDKNSKITNDLIEILKQNGLKSDEIETVNFDISPL